MTLQPALAQRLEKALAVREPPGSPARIDTEVRRLEVRESVAPGSNVRRYALFLATHARLVAAG